MGRDWLRKYPGLLSNLASQNTSDKRLSPPSSMHSLQDAMGTVLNKHAKLFDNSNHEALKGHQAKVYPQDENSGAQFYKAAPVSYASTKQMDAALDDLLQDGIIKPVKTADFACPIIAAPKPDGKMRVCGNYKLTVNKVLKVEQYPLPTLEDLLQELEGGKRFSKLDLSHAYHQIELDPEAREFTTINAHKGLFEYTRLPFGISSAPAMVQRTMHCLEKAASIIKDPHHPGRALFSLLLSGRKYSSLKSHTTRFSNSYFRTSIRLCRWDAAQAERGMEVGAVGSRQGAVGSGQGAVGSGQGAVGSGQGAVGSGQGAVGSGQGAVGSRQYPRPFRGQRHGALRRDCLRAGRLFDDPLFPAGGAVLGDVAVPVAQWRRPHDIHGNPQFFVGGASRFDVCQGSVGDCWFLAALASLTLRCDLFAHVVPPDQDFQQDYCGLFHFRFWYYGDWVDVVVDDRLPTDDEGQLIFVRSCDNNEFWVCLLEKAYAKLYGSYGDLHMGQMAEAMVDFTGGVKREIRLDNPPPDLWRTLRRAITLGSFVGCSTAVVSDGERRLDSGLVMTHAYSLTAAEEVECQNQVEELVRVRNPWGNDVEWKGAWSDGSAQWGRISPNTRQRLLLQQDDGEFWMSLQDFTEHFSQLVICSLTPDFVQDRGTRCWALSTHHGSWVRGYSAGGPLHNNANYGSNPQYCVTLGKEDMEPDSCTSSFLLSLLQKPQAQQRNKNCRLHIACHLFQVPPTVKVLNQKLACLSFGERFLVSRGLVYCNTREVSHTYQLGPGTYLMVPSTLQPNQAGDFILRTYFQRSRHHSTSSLSRQEHSAWEQTFDKYAQVPEPRWPPPHFSQHDEKKPLSPNPMSPTDVQIWQSWGQQNSSTEGIPLPTSPSSPPPTQSAELYAAGLQRVMNEVFLCGDPAPNGVSLDHCRSLLMQLSFDGTARLNKHEFRRLWKKLESLKELFQKRDVDGSGLLDVTDLLACLRDVGYPVGRAAQKLLSLRYSDVRGRVSLDSFILCFLRMESATKMFTQLSRGRAGLHLNAAEWMLLTTYF
ncbi:calpain-2 catalytic subunit-like [Rhinoraja longicauda]